MTQYETAFLISPNLEEEAIEKVISQMAEVVKKKGKLINEDRWGKKKLAYPIQKFEEAFYVFFLYEADPTVPFELERRFKQTEAILRYLTIRKETKEKAGKKEKEVPEEESLPESEEIPTEGEEAGGDIEEAVEKKEEDEGVEAEEEAKVDEKKEAVEKEEKVDEEASLPEEKEKEED